jgi:preprotein translocase subunit SecA
MKRFASDRVAGLMERMGLEDDVAIESRLVSKTIESAQSRVEGFNFDMRKRVVEFDDVINRQRETIYEERNKVLRNEDLTETVRSFVEEEIHALVDQHLSADAPDDWGLEALEAGLRAMGLEGEGTSEDELWEIGSRDAILEHLLELAETRLDAREDELRQVAIADGRGAEAGEAEWALVERMVLLRTIDSLWVEHLTEIDDMRRGIGLRGYAQQDPLNEFRREAYQLYGELRDLIRHQVATTIFRVTVTRQAPPEQNLARSLAEGAARIAAGAAASGVAAAAGAGAGGAGAGTATATRPASGPKPVGPVVGGGLAADPMAGARTGDGANGVAAGAAGQARPGFTPSGARIGRNDPCWCGSGQKYKKCHGR